MADYWGLRAIARRLKIDVTTLMRWQVDKGFFATRRIKPGCRVPQWYCTDEMILAWQVARSKADVELLRRHGRSQQQRQRIWRGSAPASQSVTDRTGTESALQSPEPKPAKDKANEPEQG